MIPLVRNAGHSACPGEAHTKPRGRASSLDRDGTYHYPQYPGSFSPVPSLPILRPRRIRHAVAVTSRFAVPSRGTAPATGPACRSTTHRSKVVRRARGHGLSLRWVPTGPLTHGSPQAIAGVVGYCSSAALRAGWPSSLVARAR